jgi:hypothetical protein
MPHIEPDNGGPGDPRLGCLFALAINLLTVLAMIAVARCS